MNRGLIGALSTSVAIALLAGCCGSQPSPDALRTTVRAVGATTRPRSGIYVLAANYSSGEETVVGYTRKNPHNNPPICTVTGVPTAAAMGVDQNGDLLVGVSGSEILVFGGPNMCGSQVGSFTDPYGQHADIATKDAISGKIAVANVFDGSRQSHSAGSISVCTMASGCSTNLTNPAMYEVYGVAMDVQGNCWASATNESGTATLTFFKHCAGAGQSTTGFSNPYAGGLDFDAAGNLVSMSFHNDAVYVYRGCKPACTMVAGPLALRGDTTYAHLNKRSTELIAADFGNRRIDVYAYTPTRLTFKYSFDNGISSDFIGGVAVNPPSKR